MENDLTIPDFLKIDDETRRRAWERFKPTIVEPPRDDHSAVKAYRVRKLKAEERRLSKLIDALGNRDNHQRKKLYAAIHQVEKQIAALGGA